MRLDQVVKRMNAFDARKLSMVSFPQSLHSDLIRVSWLLSASCSGGRAV
jgi:hypothetical protein